MVKIEVKGLKGVYFAMKEIEITKEDAKRLGFGDEERGYKNLAREIEISRKVYGVPTAFRCTISFRIKTKHKS